MLPRCHRRTLADLAQPRFAASPWLLERTFSCLLRDGASEASQQKRPRVIDPDRPLKQSCAKSAISEPQRSCQKRLRQIIAPARHGRRDMRLRRTSATAGGGAGRRNLRGSGAPLAAPCSAPVVTLARRLAVGQPAASVPVVFTDSPRPAIGDDTLDRRRSPDSSRYVAVALGRRWSSDASSFSDCLSGRPDLRGDIRGRPGPGPK